MAGILTGNKTTTWIYLQAGSCQIRLKIQNGAEYGNTHVRYIRLKLQYSNWWGQTNTKYILMGGYRLRGSIIKKEKNGEKFPNGGEGSK